MVDPMASGDPHPEEQGHAAGEQPFGREDPASAPALPKGLWPSPPSIPGYELFAPIGRGSSGIVYRARQLAVDREVAMKVLHPELGSKPTVVQRLQREARTTARLAHPHIVSAIDMGRTADRWWFAMEFVDGVSLALRIKRDGALSERMALRLFIPLCEALEHLWENGVVHRDIKPANILLDKTGGARLADLGLAFSHQDPSLTGTGSGTLGTPHYISPEQARDSGVADVRSDIWSFGATLFHALCARPPFEGASLAEVLSGVLYSRIPDPHRLRPELSRGLVLVLRKCLSREPAQRYQTPRELLLDLERVRERRQPKVTSRSLDPLEGRFPGWVRAGVFVAMPALVATAFLLGSALSGTNEVPAGTDAGSLGPFAALEAVASEIDRDEGLPSEHLARLAALEPTVPADQRPRWFELNAQVRDTLRREVGGLTASLVGESRDRVADGDFGGALETWREDGPRRLLRSTGFTEGELPDFVLEKWENRLRFELREIEMAQGLAVENAREALRRQRDSVHFAEIDRRVARGEWARAAELAEADAPSLLANTRYGSTRFAPGVMDPLLDDLRRDLDGRRQQLLSKWSRDVDGPLATWVEVRARTLEGDGWRPSFESEGSLADELRDAFARELKRRGLREDQFHPSGLRRATSALDFHAARLEALEDESLEGRVTADFARLETQLDGIWQTRDYAAAAAAIAAFEATVAELPGDPSAVWRVRSIEAAQLLAREAELLADLMRRARDGVRRLDGREGVYRVGNIEVRGTLEARGGPLAYRIVTGTGTAYDGRLDQNEPTAVEFFAGVAGPGERLSAEESLARALFRYREDDLREANRILRSAAFPSASVDLELMHELRYRIAGGMEQVQQEQRGRADRASVLLRKLEDASATPEGIITTVDALLFEFGDLQEVRLQREALQARAAAARAELKRTAPDDLRNAFRLEEDFIAELPGNRVLLDYDFSNYRSGTWERGDWIEDVGGWRSPAGTRGPGDLESGGVRLDLGGSLDLDHGEIGLELTLDLLKGSGPPKLVIVSVGGFHVAFVGPAFPGRGEPRWLVEGESLRELLKRLVEGEGTPAELFQAGKRHTLRLQVDRHPGRVEVELDGRMVARLHPSSPDAASRYIVLRAWEPLQLVRAKVEAQR